MQINGKLRGRITVPADASQELLRERALADAKIKTAIAGREIVRVIIVPGKLVNVVVQ